MVDHKTRKPKSADSQPLIKLGGHPLSPRSASPLNHTPTDQFFGRPASSPSPPVANNANSSSYFSQISSALASATSSPLSSARPSTVDLANQNANSGAPVHLERPQPKRGRSLFNFHPPKPRLGRNKSSLGRFGEAGHDQLTSTPHSHHHHKRFGRAQITVPDNMPFNTIKRIAQYTQNRARLWHLRHRHAKLARRRTEVDRAREKERSEMLFAQLIVGTPLVLLAASSLQSEDADEERVPVLLQQLSVRVTPEHAKHYRHMLRIHLEYGAGLGLVKWEILRGYRDLYQLRIRLRSQIKRTRTKKVKLPKLPRPKHFGLKVYRNKQNLFYGDSDTESADSENSSDDDDAQSDEDVESDDGESEEEFVDAQNDSTNLEPNSASNNPEDGAASESYHSLPLDSSVGSAPISPAQRPANQRYNSRLQGFKTPGFSTPDNGTPGRSLSRRSSINDGPNRRPNSSLSSAMQPTRATADAAENVAGEHYAKAVEEWLTKIKNIYSLRHDSNNLMQFLELSHLSLKLSAEYNFHGKEGTLMIRSFASDMGWRVSHYHPQDFAASWRRHTKKWWVLVKDSFIVIVDNIHSTKINEVFLVDSSFAIKHIEEEKEKAEEQLNLPIEENGKKLKERGELPMMVAAMPDAHNVSKKKGAKSFFLHLKNNEREIKFTASNPRELRRWQASILQMKSQTPWAEKHRFDSFAPVRKNVFGQWFVDGRDYMWVLSEALENAKDTIYVLDWWLSPELYLRRPPEGNQQWRLDRVLKRKAEQGVKIFVIVYRNVGPAIPIDSLWTKHSLLDLHPNIHVMRSPHQLANKKSLFWAHHEKLCIVDSTVAFNGGIDLCYGRWDTWQHTLTDDASKAFLGTNPTSEEWAEQRTQLFPGKDYSNARVKDFFELNKPFEDMYDRNNVPRMPWHDVHQMVLGQPARDFSRHFIQRWNYLMRQKLPSRPTPLLLPPADFTQDDLERLQLTGTCEYQVLRSSGDWSLGLIKHEQSIQNAYLQLIEESEHLIYIENQFFITSTEVDGVMIENNIGNALVQRIVRAHEKNEKWRAFILIPLMPGFEAEVDTDKASSVRIICQCQFNSISRGPHSIFYRLESMGIRPDQYISFFSLRKWGKFSDVPNDGRICTELLYIHAKCMIVDDRVAIIGSANINERSMRGMRDSEVAVCVRDTKTVESRMAGKPWKAGKFAHSLRMRLMREHLGVDMDRFDIIERCIDSLNEAARIKVQRMQQNQTRQGNSPQSDDNRLSPRRNPSGNDVSSSTLYLDVPKNAPDMSYEGADNENTDHEEMEQFPDWLYPELHSFNWYGGTKVNPGMREHKKHSADSRIANSSEHKAFVKGDGPHTDHSFQRSSSEQVETKERLFRAMDPDMNLESEAKLLMNKILKDPRIRSMDHFKRVFYSEFTKIDITRPLKRAADLPMPHTDEEGLRAVNNENIPIDPWQFEDPLDDRFLHDRWLAVAERNTLIFRLVFRCQPDDEVETWKDYKQFQGHLERFYEKQREDGGPMSLRRQGHHEPDRVDKYVLGGAIKRPNPEVLRQNIKKATDVDYYHSQMDHQQRTESPSHKKLIQHTPSKGSVPSHPELHRYAENLKESIGSKLTSADRRLQSQLENLHLKSQGSDDASQNRRHKHQKTPEDPVLGEATEFNSEFPSEKSQGKIEEGESLTQNDKFTTKTKSGGEQPPVHDTNGYVDAVVNDSDTNDSKEVNKTPTIKINGRSHNGDKSLSILQNHHKDRADGVSSSDTVASAKSENTISFPEIDSAPHADDSTKNGAKLDARIKHKASVNSGRWMSNSVSGSTKPSRKWGHFEHVLDAQVSEDMLQGITGHLVTFPTEWLNRELDSGNWNFQLDRIAPLDIYD